MPLDRSNRVRELSYADRQRADGRWPIVLRFAAMAPSSVAGVIAHAERRIGDVSHTDPQRQQLNEILIGDNQIAQRLAAECAEMREFNLRSNLLGLENFGRRADARRLRLNGPGDPWVRSNNSEGPLREGIVSVHRDFFNADDDCPDEFLLEFLNDEGEISRHDLRKHHEFKDAAHTFFGEEFGSACVYARYDLDEQSGHVHFLISDRVHLAPSARSPHGRWVYRTTHHRTIGGVGDERRGYEVAQDVIADFFAQPQYEHLKIVRGEARAKAAREATAAVDAAIDSQELDAFFLRGERVPDGSEKARRAWILKRLSAEAKNRSGRLRKGEAVDCH